MKILQINSVVNSGSTGRIMEDIGRVLMANGHESYIAYGRADRPSESKLIKIGSKWDNYVHGAYTLLLDRHGFASQKATKALIKKIDQVQPDAIGLHNLHGYYINIEILFNYLKKINVPVLWTLFDCWTFTGHCSYFDDINCEKWKTQCEKCPKYHNYPKSLFFDNSFKNFRDKKALFTSLDQLEIVVHSNWLAGLVKQSFLKETKVHVTPTALDLNVFKPVESELRAKYNLGQKKIILGCANIWTARKGLKDFIELEKIVDDAYKIVLIGLNDQELKDIPASILGLKRTESLKELVEWYSLAEVFINPTSQDNFPTTNIEALACGTPVITYDTGGSPEAIDEQTGIIVEKGDVDGLAKAVLQIAEKDQAQLTKRCRQRAEQNFNKDTRYLDYLGFYKELVNYNTV